MSKIKKNPHVLNCMWYSCVGRPSLLHGSKRRSVWRSASDAKETSSAIHWVRNDSSFPRSATRKSFNINGLGLRFSLLKGSRLPALAHPISCVNELWVSVGQPRRFRPTSSRTAQRTHSACSREVTERRVVSSCNLYQ